MRTRPLILGACVGAVLACTSNPAPDDSLPAQLREYAGVYISTPEEDYFVPCGIEGVGDSWSLDFRAGERQAPFLKKVTAVRGYSPLTHFIRIRGRLGPSGSYNAGFQKREVAVDSVVAVKETLEPCVGYGIAPAWRGVPQRIRLPKGIALSYDGSLAALMDSDRQISIWATDRGALVNRISSNADGDMPSGNAAPMTFSRDGKLLAVGIGGIVRVWQVADGKTSFSLVLRDSADAAREAAKIPPRREWGEWRPVPPPNSYRMVQDIIFNKSGTMLATTNLFGSAVWSMKTGRKLAEFNRGNAFPGRLFFVGDEGLLMTADSGRFAFRSKLDAAPVYWPGTRAAYPQRMTMSPDGRWIAVSAWDSVFLWSVADSKPGRVLPVPGSSAGTIAFSQDGNIIATPGGSDGLYLWDTRSGAPIRSFHNFPGPISNAWFSADGKSIITFSTFDDRFRIVYLDSSARAAAHGSRQDDSLTALLPLGPPPSTSPRTVGAIVTGPNHRAVPGAEVSISNGDAPDALLATATTSSGGYVSFPGIRFRHVVLRARKPGFQPGIQYIHLMSWSNDGPWGIELGAPRAEDEMH